jgi:hypothetical protein
MLASGLLEFRAKMRAAGVIFAYCGYVSEPMLTGVGEALKQKLATEDMDTKTLRSVFAVFVEQMQNIIRYSAETEMQHSAQGGAEPSEIPYGVITIGRNGRGFRVEAGNLVHAKDMEQLQSRLELIQKADRAELKALYRETLKNSQEEVSKGAGVGFIEIARRASKPIEFDFTNVDEQFAFFALRAEI